MTQYTFDAATGQIVPVHDGLAEHKEQPKAPEAPNLPFPLPGLPAGLPVEPTLFHEDTDEA